MDTQNVAASVETKKPHKKKSQFKEIWKRFTRNKMAVFGLLVLSLMIFVSVFADVIAPYDFDAQDLTAKFLSPSAAHLMGTDNFGRDIFSRILYGSRVSLQVGLISVGIGAIIGGAMGAVAAFYGGYADTIIMRIVDIMIAMPGILLAIAICAALGPGMVNTMIAVGISSVPTYARVVRSSVLTIKQQEFIEAARAIGANDGRLILRHIIPNSLAPIIVQASLGVARAILAAASMSFIGLGIQPPNPEWGAMLSAGRGYIRNYPHMVFYPGLAIMITIFSMNLLGDGLRDALDPRLKR